MSETFFTRTAMYRDLVQALRGVNLDGRWLSISSQPERLLRHFPGAKASIDARWYPQVDWCQLVDHDESFDVVFSDQVLEHVRYPWRALDETFRVLRPGGIHVCTTCSLNPVHRFPEDFWRFMPDGLGVLHERFHILHAGSWGSGAAVKYLTTGRTRETNNETAPLANLNDPAWPIHVWLIARKPVNVDVHS